MYLANKLRDRACTFSLSSSHLVSWDGPKPKMAKSCNVWSSSSGALKRLGFFCSHFFLFVCSLSTIQLQICRSNKPNDAAVAFFLLYFFFFDKNSCVYIHITATSTSKTGQKFDAKLTWSPQGHSMHLAYHVPLPQKCNNGKICRWPNHSNGIPYSYSLGETMKVLYLPSDNRFSLRTRNGDNWPATIALHVCTRVRQLVALLPRPMPSLHVQNVCHSRNHED